jgi:minor extracellular protease Epr
MTALALRPFLPALALIAALDVGLGLPFGLLPEFAGPAFAQDDDDGDDGDDDDDDDDDDDRPRAGRGGDGAIPGQRNRRSVRRAPVAPVAAPLPQRAAGEIVVTGLSDADLASLLTEGFAVIETLSIVRNGPILHRMRVPPGVALEAGRDRVRARESGQNADFNHYYRAGQTVAPASAASPATAAAPASCAHLNCDALTQIDWPLSRPETCRATVDIGVIDTGVNLDHAGLAAAQVELIRLTDGALRESGETHGTAVVSLFVGDEARAPGLLPEARIIAVDIFGRDGGDERADVVHLVQALDVLAQRGVRVANLSLAGPENQVLTDMLAAVADSGMLVVAAAGNAGPAAPPAWPAAAETVLSVTAVDRGDRIYRRAQRGLHLDLAAPGVEVWSAASVSGVKPRTGTSFAAPFATAAAAILLSRDPGLAPAGAIEAMRGLTRDLGDAGADAVFGTGVLSLGNLCGEPVE